MKLPPLTRGLILRRYKRFLADVELPSGELITAHCPNTGSMTGCWEPGAPVELTFSDNPKRKLAWTLERVDMGSGWVGVNTGRTNEVMHWLVSRGHVPDLSGYSAVKREPVYLAPGFPRSRFDMQLTAPGRRDCFVEVKNTTFYTDGAIRFPDAVTDRGRKHLLLLQHAVAQGHRGVILFAVNRPEGDHFSPARQIDPDYTDTLKSVMADGVEAMAVRIRHTPKGMRMGGLLPIHLAG